MSQRCVSGFFAHLASGNSRRNAAQSRQKFLKRVGASSVYLTVC
jgi:hypothetical protein